MSLVQIEKLTDVLLVLSEQISDVEPVLLDTTSLNSCITKLSDLLKNLVAKLSTCIDKKKVENTIDESKKEKNEFIDNGESFENFKESLDNCDADGESFENDSLSVPGPSESKAPVLIKFKKEAKDESRSILRCMICEEDFEDLPALELHDSTNHMTGGIFKCKGECEFKTEAKKSLVEHYAVVHKELDIFHCPDCEEMFFNIKDLANHQRDVHQMDLPKNTCPICLITFKTNKKFYGHCSVEHRKARECPECDQRYPSKEQLRRHIIAVHQKSCYTCHICGIKLKSQTRFKIHLIKHENGERPFKCPECEKGFYTKPDLERHCLSHKPKRYLCSQCDYSAALYYGLKRHLLTVHSGERNFPCPDCGVSFKTKSYLKTHQISHSNIRNYECDFCSKKFKKASQLKIHRRIHTGDYYASCCGVNFVQQGNYKLHMSKFHLNGS